MVMTTTERSEDRSLGEEAPEVTAAARPEVDDTSAQSHAKNPRERTCVGCGERVDKTAEGGAGAELVRLILGPDGEVAVDAAGGGFGRGAYVHPRRDCLAKAVTRGLPKAAKGRVSTIVDVDNERAEGHEPERTKLTVDSLAAAIRAAMTRRIRGLFTSAGRSRALALGTDAVTGASERGEAELIVVACDAAAGAELSVVRKAVAEGRAVAWGTKLELGALCSGGRGRKKDVGLAVVAVTSRRIAAALRDAVRAADACVGPRVSGPASGGEGEGAAARGGAGKKFGFGNAAGAAAVRRADGSVG